MGWNDAYWQGKNQRKEKALVHNKKMTEEFREEITWSVNHTKVYSPNSFKDRQEPAQGHPEVIVDNLDTVSAVFKYEIPDKNTIVLNFASYKNPGGGFLAGSSAQEESLCMESHLYEVLSHEKLKSFYDWNNKHKNKSLYLNRALYSEAVAFVRPYPDRPDEQVAVADVLTCAAPNRKAYMDYIIGANEVENLTALEERIAFIHDIIAEQENIGTVILGAFGCGVFGQNPETVAKMFMERMKEISADRVVYAVIDKGGHSKEGAYAIFSRVKEEFEEGENT